MNPVTIPQGDADIVVFAGPSIDARAVAGVLDVELLPPVKRGDLGQLLARQRPPRYVGIVDGEFLQGLSVSPKEIVRAIESGGLTVFGSSSMGALRAAELDDFGMVGIGTVYRMYRDGVVDADDEVAMVYDPESMRPLCEPMVNIRVAIATAVEQDVIPAVVGECALQIAKALYFPDRNYRSVLRLLGEHVDADTLSRLSGFLETNAPNAKRDDALALLRVMAHKASEKK